MMGNEHDNFTVGDVVTWTEWSPLRRTVRSTVSRVTPNRVTAQPEGDDAPRVFHRRSQGFECRRVDVAREQWHRDLEVWWEARPQTVYLMLSAAIGYASIRMSMASTPVSAFDTLHALADETEAIREWLRKRPEEPK